MAQNLAAGMLLQVTAFCKTQGQYTYNVSHWVTGVVTGTVTDSQAVIKFDTDLAPLYKAILPTNCSYLGARVQILRPTLYVPNGTTASGGVGTLAGDCLPTQIAGIISYKTALAGKSFRGRMYMPATSEADNDATAVPSAAYKALLVPIAVYYSQAQTYVAGGNSVTFTPVVFSKTKSIYTEITNYVVRDNWGTQRRRSQIKHPDTPVIP